jgi:2-phospho-L-lactate guanylyltransferase
MDAGLLPVKRLDLAKQRLLPHVTESERAAIARALLDDALSLCASATMFEWWVVTDDPDVRTLAAEQGFHLADDPGQGLNAALASGIDAVIAAGATSVTVVPADIPLAWSGDLQDLHDTSATSDVVIVPSRDGGTNALALSPPDALTPSFGDFSFKAHIAEAERLGKRCSILALPRMELDIDTIEDVDLYLARPKSVETRSSVVLTGIRAPSSSP